MNPNLHNSRLNELSLFEISQMIQDGTVEAAQLAADCVRKIEACQDELGAFTTFDSSKVFEQVKTLEHGAAKTPLFGMPVGVKDIMETAGMLTTMGSRIYSDYVPKRDATCVAMLKRAGAVIAGKTETTEFAYFYPGKTRNPHNTDHTPGGSSMGSAVAVSQRMVPFALGTQTAASVIRPAAYCGVIGYKASHGSISLAGVFGFAQSLDSIGFFVRDVRDVAVIRNALFGSPGQLQRMPDVPSIGLVKTPHWQVAEPCQRQLIEHLCDFLSNRAFEITEIEVGPSDGALTEAQATIMAYEGSRSLSAEFSTDSHLMSDPIKALIERGANTTFEAYQEAVALSEFWQRELRKIFLDFDVLLSPSAPGEAPKGLDSTGDPIFSRMWTLLKVPSINLPAGCGPNGLPLGIQLIGPFNQDDRLLAFSRQIESVLTEFTFAPQ